LIVHPLWQHVPRFPIFDSPIKVLVAYFRGSKKMNRTL
jgi:hypothetical protein